jgi:hypothetical protein
VVGSGFGLGAGGVEEVVVSGSGDRDSMNWAPRSTLEVVGSGFGVEVVVGSGGGGGGV